MRYSYLMGKAVAGALAVLVIETTAIAIIPQRINVKIFTLDFNAI